MESPLAAFASCLWQPDDMIEVRCLPSRKSWWWTAAELPGREPLMREYESRGDNVYAGANPRKAHGARGDDGVALARCVFVDIDNCSVADSGERLRELPAPTLLVFSGGGVHAYWRLDEPMTDLTDWTARQKALIARINSDRTIHNPERIMRLPGFLNHKREAAARLVGAWPDRVYLASEFPAAAQIAPAVIEPSKEKRPENVGRLTRDFLAFGAQEGERNQRAYMAACELQGNGYGRAEAEEMVLSASRRCGLPEEEARAAIASAFSKPHGPSRAPLPDFIEGGYVPGEEARAEPKAKASGLAKTAAPTPAASVAPVFSDSARSGVSNVLVDHRFVADPNDPKKTRRIELLVYRRIDDVSASLLAATGGWPKCAGGLLFSVRESPPGFLPTASNVRYFGQPVDLWAWVSEACDPFWTKQKVHDVNGNPKTPATKEEFHRHLRDCAAQRFQSVAVLPHEPKIPGIYYVPCELPTSTGKRLAEFLAMLNPETEDDRQLCLACLMTLFWGGPNGGRPMFVFDSRHGRGSGKTATAEAIAAVAGGAFRVEPDEDWETVKKRLMSDRAMSQRAVLLDNVKTRLGGPQVEGIITAGTIDGWRPYHGNFSRPNDLTWLVTQNSARGSQDAATRAVIIHIGPKRHGDSFVANVAAFIEAHRAELIADLLARLSGPVKGAVSPENRDRFQAWQDGVLARCESPDRLAALIIDRRGELDSDSEDAESVASAIAAYVTANSLPSNGDGRVRITRDQMSECLRAAKIIDDKFGKRQVYGWMLNMLGTSGPLSQLSDGRASSDGSRVWLWEVRHDIPV